jgi:hypothetical protein
MKLRAGLVVLLAFIAAISLRIEPGYADEGSDQGSDAPPAEDKDHDGKPDVPAAGEDKDHDGKPDVPAAGGVPTAGDTDGDGTPDAKEDSDGDGTPDSDEDSDGDGVADTKEDSDGDGIPDVKEDRDGDGTPDMFDDSDGDGVPDSEDLPGDVDGDGILDSEQEFDEDDPPTDPFDADGDGVVEPDEVETRKEFVAAFKDIPNEPDAQAVESLKEMLPSITIEKFRELVRLSKKVVLEKMMVKIEKKSAKKMRTFSFIVFGISGLGILLLLMPVFLAKKYPGQGKVLFKYSALAAVVFIVTVNLFGGVLYGFRTVQGAMANHTNPSIAIASGTFDTLDNDAEYFTVIGKELFGPSLEMMRKNPEQQPAEIILENGLRIVKDAKVFISIKNMFKKVDFVFGTIPIVLTILTLVLFVLAIRPTLMEIIKLPATAASGAGGGTVGKDIVAKSMRRVFGELKATVCTVGVLIVLTLVSSFVLGKTVGPALRAFLEYFARSVSYLAFSEGASSGLVFMALFGVILFLVFNLATLILSMAFFLGKSQKIFQQRFNEGIPLSTHARFFKWGVPSVLLVQLFPLVFAFGASALLAAINNSIMEGATSAEQVSWTKFLLMGPLVLVAVFLVLFWAVRGVKALKFLATYKVKVKAPPGVA